MTAAATRPAISDLLSPTIAFWTAFESTERTTRSSVESWPGLALAEESESEDEEHVDDRGHRTGDADQVRSEIGNCHGLLLCQAAAAKAARPGCPRRLEGGGRPRR